MDLRSSLIRATLLGLVILGIGGRLLMRVVAHMEGRTPAFTLEGSVAVVFWGTVAGAFSGLVYYLLQRFVKKSSLRSFAFIVICGLVSWRGVSGLLPVPQAMFMALALGYLVIVDVLGRRAPLRPASAVGRIPHTI
jgi:peptidoglycan/LPS O-acetylase OafA/YrhL